MLDHTQFMSARENMEYDKDILAAQPQDIFVRVYHWPESAGITLPENRHLPDLLSLFDYSVRPTGGGIVFHCPMDVLFTVIVPLNHSDFPKRLKDKLLRVSEGVLNALRSLDLPVQLVSSESAGKNLAFCQSYFSPYELYLEGAKICGLTLKKHRTHCIFQGIIHLNASRDFFGSVESELGCYFARGIEPRVNSKDVLSALSHFLI
jgi:lipoate-protein ligase A